MTEQNAHTFRAEVCQWLTNWRLNYGVTEATGYAKIEAGGIVIVLDFLSLPYQKPEAAGYHFSLDHFLFHRAALHSRLASIFHKTETVFARNCQARRIEKALAEPFFAQNHLSGYASAKFKYGLFYKEQLLAAITFAQGRNFALLEKNVRSFELIGFCQASGITVTGGMSKLLKTFIADKKPQHLATTVDLDWASGKSLITIGFAKTKQLPPLPFAVNWRLGQRLYPSREARNVGEIDKNAFPYVNSGYAKFEYNVGN